MPDTHLESGLICARAGFALAAILQQRSFCSGLAPSNLLWRVHGAPAYLRAAVAVALIVAAVVEAVVVGDLLARLDVADGHDPDPAVLLVGFAIGIATMVDEHRR